MSKKTCKLIRRHLVALVLAALAVLLSTDPTFPANGGNPRTTGCGTQGVSSYT
ncbi:MAG: hypothetical protein ABIQ18_01650 [Umezawaea sp.]